MMKTLKPVLALTITALLTTGAAAQSVQDAQRALEVERYTTARATLLKAVSGGGSDEAYFTLGKLYARLGKPDSAAYYFSQGANKFGSTTTGRISAGAALLQTGNVGGAEAKFEEVRTQTKRKDADALIKIAEAYIVAPEAVKDLAKPIADLQLVKDKLRPNDAYVLTTLGDAYLKTTGQGGAAMTAYESALRANATDTRALYHKGVLNVRARNNNGARDDFQQVIKQDPSYAPAYAELADIYYHAGLYKEATQMITEYRNRAENSAASQAKYAAFLYLSKDYPAALTALNTALARDSSNLILRRLQAYSLYETKNYKGSLAALERYRAVAKPEEQIGSDFVYYGRALSKSGREDEALPLLLKAMAADSSDRDLQQEVAQLYLKKKQYPQAIGIYRQRIRAAGDKPSNTDLYYLGDSYEKSGRFASADSAYRVITEKNPTFYLAYYKRGIANAGLDPTSEKGLSRPYFQQFIDSTRNEKDKYRPQLATANKAIAFTIYRKGDRASKQQSLPYWQEALAMDANDEQAKTAIKDITSPVAVRAAPRPAGKKPAGRK